MGDMREVFDAMKAHGKQKKLANTNKGMAIKPEMLAPSYFGSCGRRREIVTYYYRPDELGATQFMGCIRIAEIKEQGQPLSELTGGL